MKKLIISLLSTLLPAMALESAGIAHAQVDIGQKFGPAKNFKDIGSLVNVIVPNFMIFAGIVCFLIVLIAGFKMIQSAGGGDPHETEQSQKAFGAAIAGFLLIFAAYWIVQILKFVMGINIPGF